MSPDLESPFLELELLFAQTTALCNIGLIQQDMGNLSEAGSSFLASLALEEKSGHLPGMAASHGNFGLLCRFWSDLKAAEIHSQEALAVIRETGDLSGQAKVLSNLSTFA